MGLPKGRTNNPNGCPARTAEQLRAHLIAKRRLSQSGCWEWTGPLNEWGYGQIGWRGKHTVVSRMAAHIWLNFDLNDPRRVCHRCDNPSCFNPDHFFFGTDADNSRDCTDKCRQHQQQKTHCAHGHEFTAGNTSIKTRKIKTGIGYERRCRTCHREQSRARTRRYQ